MSLGFGNTFVGGLFHNLKRNLLFSEGTDFGNFGFLCERSGVLIRGLLRLDFSSDKDFVLGKTLFDP